MCKDRSVGKETGYKLDERDRFELHVTQRLQACWLHRHVSKSNSPKTKFNLNAFREETCSTPLVVCLFYKLSLIESVKNKIKLGLNRIIILPTDLYLC